MLYDAARHEPLRALPWDETRARAAMERLVLDAESRFDDDCYWPLHPLDRQAGATKPFETAMYDGACADNRADARCHRCGRAFHGAVRLCVRRRDQILSMGNEAYFWAGVAAAPALFALPFLLRAGASLLGRAGLGLGLVLAGCAVWLSGLFAANFRIICTLF
jgi:hypothetical protein